MSKEVILIEDVSGLGEQGQVVKVNDGYARNYLIPKKLATPVSASSLRQLERKQAEYEEHRRQLREDAEKLAAQLSEIELTIPAKVGAEDKIFGSITALDIVEKLAENKVTLEKHQVILETPIRELGSFKVPIRLTSEIHPHLSVNVVAE